MATADILCPPDTCPVCLSKLKKCELGKPENCSHYFCLQCIFEWSKNVNTCPVDRKIFNNIEVFTSVKGAIVRKIHIPDRRFEDVLVDPESLTYCEVCHLCDRENILLLCDGCDKGYHMTCLVPSLRSIPRGNWYCELCSDIVYRSTTSLCNTSSPKSTSGTEERTGDVSDCESISWSVEDESNGDEIPVVSSSHPLRMISSSHSDVDSTTGIEKKFNIDRGADSNLQVVEEVRSEVTGSKDKSTGPVKQRCDHLSGAQWVDCDDDICSGSGSGSIDEFVFRKGSSYYSHEKSNVCVTVCGKDRVVTMKHKITDISESLQPETIIVSSDSPSDDSEKDYMIRKTDKQPYHITLRSGGGVLVRDTQRQGTRISRRFNDDSSSSSSSDNLLQGKDKKRTRMPSHNSKKKAKRICMPKKKRISPSNIDQKYPRARTAATHVSSPWYDPSIREAVIASQKHKHFGEGLRVAQETLQKFRASPPKRLNQLPFQNNISIPSTSNKCRKTLFFSSPNKQSLDQCTSYSQGRFQPSSHRQSPLKQSILNGTPTVQNITKYPTISLSPNAKIKKIVDKNFQMQSGRSNSVDYCRQKQLDVTKPTTTDYVGQIKEELEDLSATQCVFKRDGSIVPIKDFYVTSPTAAGPSSIAALSSPPMTSNLTLSLNNRSTSTNQSTSSQYNSNSNSNSNNSCDDNSYIDKTQHGSSEYDSNHGYHTSKEERRVTWSSDSTTTVAQNSNSCTSSQTIDIDLLSDVSTRGTPGSSQNCRLERNRRRRIRNRIRKRIARSSQVTGHFSAVDSVSESTSEVSCCYDSPYDDVTLSSKALIPNLQVHKKQVQPEYQSMEYLTDSDMESCDVVNDSTDPLHAILTLEDTNERQVLTTAAGLIMATKRKSTTVIEEKEVIPFRNMSNTCDIQLDRLHYVVPSTGQSVPSTSSSLMPLPPMYYTQPHLPALPPLSQAPNYNMDVDSTRDPRKTKNLVEETELDLFNNENSMAYETKPQQSLPFSSSSVCFLDSAQATVAVKRHFELHYIAGNITADVMENLKKRAIKKVQMAKKVVPLERVRKLVDEYVALHHQTKK